MSINDFRAQATTFEVGACRVVILPGATLIDLRTAKDASTLFDSLERIRDALSARAPAASQVWVASSERLEALDDHQFGKLTQSLYDCFGASRCQSVVFERPDPDPALVHLLGSLGMQVLPPGSLEIIHPRVGLVKLDVLPFLASF